MTTVEQMIIKRSIYIDQFQDGSFVAVEDSKVYQGWDLVNFISKLQTEVQETVTISAVQARRPDQSGG